LFEPSFNLTQAVCNRNPLWADIRTPPHGFATPDTVIGIDHLKPIIGGRVAGIENVPEDI